METKSLDVPKAELQKAVEGLQKLMKMTNKKSDILQEREKIHLQVGMKKIPNLPEQTIGITLPHGLYTADTDVCLFVKDLDKSSREFELSEDHFKDMLVDKGVGCIRKIIPLKALKLEYKPYEAKRNLSNEFDLFLADARIIRLLPSQLGKHFYGRKRIPIQVDLEAKNLKEEISKAVNSTRCVIKNRGSSCLMTVGHSDMSRDQIVENVLKAVEQLSQKFPGGADNIRSLYVKTTSSTSVPFFVSLDSGDSVVFPPRKKQKKAAVIDEITTVMDKKVKVMPDGTVKLLKTKENGGKKLNRKRNIPHDKETNNVEGVSTISEDVEIKVEYDSQEENAPEPATKKVKITTEKKSVATPNSGRLTQKLQKTPKNAMGKMEPKGIPETEKSVKKSQLKTPKKSPKAVEAKKSNTPVSNTPGGIGSKATVEKENQKSGKKKQNGNNTPIGKTRKTPKVQSTKKGKVSDVVIKQEGSDGDEVELQTPAKKSKAKTPNSKALTGTPKSAGKVQGKTPKSATMEKAAKKLKEITPPTVKRLQSKAKVLTPDTPSRKQK